MRLLVAALFALFAAAATDASPVELNGQRLARGLPPLPPAKFRRTLPGFANARRDPTPAFAAKRSSPSGKPSEVTYSGRIEVRNGDGKSDGFVSSNYGDISIVDTYSNPKNDLYVTFTIPSGKTGPVNVAITNAGAVPPLYIGAESQPAPDNFLAAGSGNTAAFTNVTITHPGTPGKLVDGKYEQSAIWSFDTSTLRLIPQYINLDGSKPPTTIAYDAHANKLFFVGDINQWNSRYPNTPATAVTFVLVY